MSNSNTISVILTVRNEEQHIGKCLDSIISSELPDDIILEIVIVDGMSTDSTRQIIQSKSDSQVDISIVENVRLNHAHGFNLGIEHSSGQWVVWLGAHSIYNKSYILGLYNTATKNNTDYCGGVINTLAHDDSYSASVVQAITTHKFGVGNSGFRTNATDGPADTASYGMFNRDIFCQIGLFDERLLRAQDYEYNRRIKANGGIVWLNPNLVVDYYNQPNLTSFLKKQLLREAPYNAYMWYLAPYTFSYRHAITGLFSASLIIGLILSLIFPWIAYAYITIASIYIALAVYSSISQALRYKKMLHCLTLPISFFLYHFLHGVGVVGGIILIAIGKSPVQKIREPWQGYRRFRVKISGKLNGLL